ncbi:MAG: exosortase/archaeosortase family protein [Tepidisphaeraceae bacterium]
MSSILTSEPSLDRNGICPASGRPARLGWLGLSVQTWTMAGLLLAAFIAAYWPNLRRLWLKTNPFDGAMDWAHASFVPIIGLYYLYLHIDDLKKAGASSLLGLNFTKARFISAIATAVAGLFLWLAIPRLHLLPDDYANLVAVAGKGVLLLAVMAAVLDWGLGSLLFGVLAAAYGIYPGQNDFLKDVGMVVTVFGVVLTLCGWRVMRIAWFPIALLLCALPWPGLFYQRVTLPMREVSAYVGVMVMQLFGVDAEYSATKMFIHLPNATEPRVLDVAEACAGIKSLMTFVTLAAALGFVFHTDRPLWQKLFVTAAAVPIAIACNVMRIAGQGLLDRYVSQSLSEGFTHLFVGVFFLIPGFILIMSLFWLLDLLFIEEADDEDETPSTKPAKAGGAA